MPDQVPEGKIVTFYSYKGGTGRSMALANVAWILASNGKRVLTLDWDMEAPGLHRYFYPFLHDKDLSSSEGLIDFVIKFITASATPSLEDDDDDGDAVPEQSSTTGTNQARTETRTETKQKIWYEPYTNILRYATSLNWRFDNGGTLDFIPSGRQGPSYGTRVNSFNWKRFYEVLNGGVLLEIAKEKMRAEYDYILIDSRTGVSDTSGICTVQMPDILVICFTLNNQSIEGASAVATAVYEQRSQPANVASNNGRAQASAAKAESQIQIFPVPTRIENAEKVKLQTRKEYAKDKFKLFPNGVPGEEREHYWGNVPIIYVPYYAYEEILAPFGDNSADRISILAAAEQLTSYLTGGEITKLPTISDEERKRILTQFETGVIAEDPAEKEDAFAEYVIKRLPTDEQEMVRRVFMRLVRVAGAGEVGGDTPLCINLSEITAPDSRVLRKLIDSSLVKKDYDYRNKQETITVAQDSLLKSWKRLQRWLSQDREFLLWRQRLDTKIDEWEKNEKEKGALLSGTLLEDAQKWLKEKSEDLNPTEVSYINASTEEVQRLFNEQKEAQLKHLLDEQKEVQFKKRMFRIGIWATFITIVVGIIAAYTALNPLKTEDLVKWRVDVQHDYWIISKDRSLAVSFTRNKPSSVWKPGTQWKNRTEMGVAFDRIIISPHATFLAGLTSDKRLFIWRPDEKLTEASQPALTIPAKQYADDVINFRYYQMAFSSDDKWFYVISPEGLYLLQPTQTLGSNAQPNIPIKSYGNVRDVPTVTFSPGGKFLAITDNKANLVIRRLDDITKTSRSFLVNLDDFDNRAEVFFSSDDRWAATTGTDGKVYLADLNLFPGIYFQSVLEPAAPSSASDNFNSWFRIYFSPKPENQWVIAKRRGGELYAWRIGAPADKKAKPLIEIKEGRGGETSDAVGFSADGLWAAAKASDYALYVWQLGKDYGGKLEPAIPKVEVRRNAFIPIFPDYKFSPNGDWIAGNSADGRVFIWKLGSSPDLTEPQAFLAVDDISFAWCQDNFHIFAYGGGDVFFGEAGSELKQLPRAASRIQGITELSDPQTNELNELVIFGERHLSAIWRRRSFWNYTYRTDSWPTLSKD